MSDNGELVVGVIGGLGPEATLDFFGKVLAHSKAKKDQDHIHLIIENNPKTPNRNDAIAGRGISPGPALAAMAAALDRAGGVEGNRGADAARAAVELANLMRTLER